MSKGIMLMEINQPIGSFYIGKINSADLIKISKVIPRKIILELRENYKK